MKREDLVLLDGAEHKKTWYLLDGAEHNKQGYCWPAMTVMLSAASKCVLELASDIVPQMDDGTQVYKFDCDWPSELECNSAVQSQE